MENNEQLYNQAVQNSGYEYVLNKYVRGPIMSTTVEDRQVFTTVLQGLQSNRKCNIYFDDQGKFVRNYDDPNDFLPIMYREMNN